MKITRRNFLVTAASASAVSAFPAFGKDTKPNDDALEKASARPVLDLKPFKDPIVIESVELLKKGREYFVRVRSKDGAEGIAVDNGRADVLHPVFTKLVAPYFVGKDARDLEEHL